MTPLDKLIAYFEKFPGTGGRQAKRFAFHILTLKDEQVTELANLITSLPNSVNECTDCHRFFSLQRQPIDGKCPICADLSRDRSKLIIIARDSDIQAIERSGVYDGLYFVLGGTVPLLSSSESNSRVRTPAFRALVAQRLTDQTLKEIIFAFAINPDGENTVRYIENVLKEIPNTSTLKISELGRGLSTGSELEYADSETIKNALRNRS